MDGGIHVAIAAETLGEWMGIPITNTLLMSLLVLFALSLTAVILSFRASLFPGKIQLLFEILLENVFNFVSETLESKELARKYFPLLTTMFLFIFVANLFEFIPGVGAIGYLAHGHDGEKEFVPLLRSMNTDLNVTLALSLIAFFTIEISGIVIIGFFKYFGRFFNTHSVMGFIVGIIEFFSELVRLISFSFRLFGNIFAGEVLLMVIAFFVPFILPVPFMIFEIFVGFMQAAIFALLTLFFIKLAVTEVAH
jgi:F-type H+-transporting ATPase subunit a